MDTLTLQLTAIERLKLFVRRILAATVFYSGINTLYRFLARKSQAVVLMYHRVIDRVDLNRAHFQPGMYVTKEAFEMQMRYLTQHYNVVSLQGFAEIMKSGNKIPANTCVLTFDDGWKDTYTNVFPILKKYNLPATVFLVSSYIGTDQWFWPEEVSFLLTKGTENIEIAEANLNNYPALNRVDFYRIISNPDITLVQKIEMIIETLKRLDQEGREKVIDELRDFLKCGSVPDPSMPLLLSWDKVIEMSRHAITFGSHTKTHAILTKVSTHEAIEEIFESKRDIEKRLSSACLAFCYPNGDYNNQIKRVVKDHYTCSFTTEQGFVKQGDDLFAIKRVGIHNDITFTKALFACKITGIIA